jgi:hypothetical protein
MGAGLEKPGFVDSIRKYRAYIEVVLVDDNEDKLGKATLKTAVAEVQRLISDEGP